MRRYFVLLLICCVVLGMQNCVAAAVYCSSYVVLAVEFMPKLRTQEEKEEEEV